jgi:hypothetical protein
MTAAIVLGWTDVRGGCDMSLFLLAFYVGTGAGVAAVGWQFGRPMGIAMGLVGGVVGGVAGIAYCWGYLRVTFWLAGATGPWDTAETSERATSAEAETESRGFGLSLRDVMFTVLVEWPTMIGVVLSFFCTITALVVPFAPAKPDEEMRWKVFAALVAMAIGGYVMIWGAQKLRRWAFSS